MVTDNTSDPAFPRKVDFSIRRGGSVVYSSKFTYERVDLPLKGLHAWQNHWVLEVTGDGQWYDVQSGRYQ